MYRIPWIAGGLMFVLAVLARKGRANVGVLDDPIAAIFFTAQIFCFIIAFALKGKGTNDTE